MCIRAPPISSSVTSSPITICGHPRRAEVHRGVAVAHHDDVAEGRDVGAAGRRGPEQHADLRHPARHPHLVVEDPPGAAPAREHLHLVGDPGPGRVDEVDHRQLEAERPLLDPDDLLDRLRAPRAGLDGRVVGHQGDAAAADRAEAGDDAVGAEPLGVPVGEQRLLGEAARRRAAARPARGPAACPARRSSRDGARARRRAPPRAAASSPAASARLRAAARRRARSEQLGQLRARRSADRPVDASRRAALALGSVVGLGPLVGRRLERSAGGSAPTTSDAPSVGASSASRRRR